MKLDSKDLAFKAGAAIVSGIATAVVAPTVASKLANTADPKNWYATGGVAIVLGAGIMLLGGKENVPVAAAGAAMIGAGASFAYLGYQGYKLAESAKAPAQAAQGNLMTMGNLVGAVNSRGAQPAAWRGNVPAAFPSWSGVPATAQRYNRSGTIPVASRGGFGGQG